MSKYLKLWLAVARNSLLRQTEFKINFIGRLLVEFVWILTQILFFEAVFSFIPSLSGWTRPEIWFFLGTLFFVDGLWMMLFYENQTHFGESLRLGLLDFYLLYPASSLFLANLRFVNVVSIGNLLGAFCVLAWAAMQPGFDVSLLGWGIWLVYSLIGLLMVAALSVIVCSTAFWTTQTSSLLWLFFEIYRLGHRPESLYAPWLRRLVLTIFPAAFFISVPVQLSLGKLGGAWFAYPLIAMVIIGALAKLLWSQGIKRYEGALS